MSRDLVVGDWARIRDPALPPEVGEIESISTGEFLSTDALVRFRNDRREWVDIDLLQYVPPLVALAYQVVDE